MATIKFTIPGRPVGKPRMTRRDKWLNPPRPCVAKYRAWADVARQSSGKLPDPMTITEVRCVAFFPPPDSWPQRRKDAAIRDMARYRVRPDSDNVSKSLLDSLFKNDAAIADLVVRKRYAAVERLEVEIDYEETR